MTEINDSVVEKTDVFRMRLTKATLSTQDKSKWDAKQDTKT